MVQSDCGMSCLFIRILRNIAAFNLQMLLIWQILCMIFTLDDSSQHFHRQIQLLTFLSKMCSCRRSCFEVLESNLMITIIPRFSFDDFMPTVKNDFLLT